MGRTITVSYFDTNMLVVQGVRIVSIILMLTAVRWTKFDIITRPNMLVCLETPLISVGKEVSLCEAYFTEFTAMHPAYARMRRSTS